MGLELARAFVTIHADMDSLHEELASGKEDIKRQIESMTGGFEKLAGLIGIGFGIHELISVSHEAIAAASEHMQAAARLGAVIAATGGAAGYSAEQMEEYAKGLAKVGIASKMQIVEAETALARHKEIRGEMFQRAVAASADLGAANQTNPAAAANMLGRALESPQRGMMMLRRLHVDISEEQRKQITHLTKLGQLDKAREIILTAVEASTKGFNAALAATPAGQLEKLEQKLHEARAELGEKLMPAAIAWKNLQITLFEATARIIEPLSKMVLLAVKFNEAAGSWPVKIVGIAAAFGALSLVFGGLPAAIAVGIGAFVAFSESGQKLLELFMEVVDGITEALKQGDWAAAGEIAITGLQVALLNGVVALSTSVGGSFGDFLGMIGKQILTGDLRGAWTTALSGLYDLWAEFSKGIVELFTAAMEKVIGAFGRLARIMQGEIEKGTVFGKILGLGSGINQEQAAKERRHAAELYESTMANYEWRQKKLDEEFFNKGTPGYRKEEIKKEYAAIQKQKQDALKEFESGGISKPADAEQIFNQDPKIKEFRANIAMINAQAAATAAKAASNFNARIGGGALGALDAANAAQKHLDDLIENIKDRQNINPLGIFRDNVDQRGLFRNAAGPGAPGRGGGFGGGLGMSPLDQIGAGRLGGFADVGKKIQDALIKGQTGSLEEQQVDLAKQGLAKQDQLIGVVKGINAGLK